MRAAALLVLVGCGFEVVSSSPNDANPLDAVDAPVDSPVDAQGTWTVDQTSGKATPATAEEWQDLIAASNLAIAPPDGLWLLQESSGVAHDSIGTADLIPTGPVKYLEPVTGWTRKAVRTDDGAPAYLGNITTSLPDVSTASMTILLVYQTASMPVQARSVLFGGSGVSSTLGQLDVDAASHLVFTAGGASATGTVSYGTDVLVAAMRLDRAAGQNHLVTNREIISPSYVALGSSRGMFIGAANRPAPAGRWLYMAAWYGSKGSISDAELQRLITALGW